MIKPTIPELLDGVADSLEESVLPELPAGNARVQLVAALAIIRRAATASYATGPYLDADNRDIAATLQSLAPSLGQTTLPQRITAAADAINTGSDRYVAIEELANLNYTLQSLLIDVQRELGAAAESFLRPLYERMLERESVLISPRSK